MTSEQKTEGKLGYRSRDEIGLAMLESLAEGSKTRTDIFYSNRLTYPQIDERIEWFEQYGLAKLVNKTLTITQKGRAYLKARQHAEAIREGVAA